MPEQTYLGKIMHIVNKEAIVKLEKKKKVPFRGDIALVQNQKIGRIGLPFGLVDEPYIPIQLDDGLDFNIIGEKVFSQRSPKKSKKFRGKKKGKRRRKNS